MLFKSKNPKFYILYTTYQTPTYDFYFHVLHNKVLINKTESSVRPLGYYFNVSGAAVVSFTEVSKSDAVSTAEEAEASNMDGASPLLASPPS